MKVIVDDSKFMRDVNNALEYSLGFSDGIHAGKNEFLKILGENIKSTLLDFIDTNARVSPETLHHVYEWYRTGSPDARLYDIEYTVSNLGLSFKSSFRQSQVLKDGSKVPFYNKAKIIESGIPVRIKPIRSKVLAFNAGGESVFTTKEVQVNNPGGTAARGGFEKTFDNFFERYLSQSFLLSSGIIKYLENPVAFKNNFGSAKTGGRSSGFQIGYRWIVNAGVMSNV